MIIREKKIRSTGALNSVVLPLPIPLFNPDLWSRPVDTECQEFAGIVFIRTQPGTWGFGPPVEDFSI